jgi:CYTH domain-containing protein
VEVERKWLVAVAPQAAMAAVGEQIDQGYVLIGTEGEEVRVRRRGERRYLTVKQGRGLVRQEVEVELSGEQYDVLWPATEGRRVQKIRRVLDGGDGLAIELDEYQGALAGLFTVEVEFSDEARARQFVPPSWFGEEVTDDDAYRNQRLAVQGCP